MINLLRLKLIIDDLVEYCKRNENKEEGESLYTQWKKLFAETGRTSKPLYKDKNTC